MASYRWDIAENYDFISQGWEPCDTGKKNRKFLLLNFAFWVQKWKKKCSKFFFVRIIQKGGQLWPQISREIDFSRICGFRGVFRHLVLSFLAEKSWDQWLRFSAKVKKTTDFLPHFRNYWMIQIFPGKFGSVTFFPLSSFNFMPIFRKILWPVFGLRTDERTDERTNVGQSIGPTSKVGGSNKQC